MIGACQGHSGAIDTAAVVNRVDPDKVPAVLLPATHCDFYKKIKESGLFPGGGSKDWRSQTHFVEDNMSAWRHFPGHTEIVLRIDPSRTTCVWYTSDNGYYLTKDVVPPTAILEVVILASGYTVVPTEAGMPPTTESVLQAVLAAFNADKGKYSKDGRKPAPQHSKPRRAYMVLAVARLHGGVQQGKPCYSEWTSASLQDRRTAVATSVEPQPKCLNARNSSRITAAMLTRTDHG